MVKPIGKLALLDIIGHDKELALGDTRCGRIVDIRDEEALNALAEPVNRPVLIGDVAEVNARGNSGNSAGEIQGNSGTD